MMQGTLNEIDMGSILQLITLSQQTGELWVESYSPARVGVTDTSVPVAWCIFFVNGQIAYTTQTHIPHLSRLQDYLGHYGISTLPDESLVTDSAISNNPEYSYLWLLLEKKIITPAQGKAILEKMAQETLFDLFNLYQGSFYFTKGVELTPQLTYIAIAPLIPKIRQQVQQWKQFYPYISSPEQCLTLRNPTALHTALSPHIYQSLVHWADGKTSLRQLSRYLNRNLTTLAKGIYPYLQRGWLYLAPFCSIPNPLSKNLVGSSSDSGLKIVCIDDDPLTGQQIKPLLAHSNYGLTCFTHPLEALSQLFELQPDLILCELAMPNLNGDELCAMLRQSSLFRHTPMIMLTESKDILNQVRARMAGASDYLIKPVAQNELLLLLNQYLPNPSSLTLED